jgi:FkbM family methyltransferase
MLDNGKYTVKRKRELDKFFFDRKISLNEAVGSSGKSSLGNLVVYDVGAHVGDTVGQFLEMLSNSSIHAFDARAESVASIRVRFQGLQNVKVHCVALSDQSNKEIDFRVPNVHEEQGGGGGRLSSVYKPNFASRSVPSHRGIKNNVPSLFELGERAWTKSSVITVTLNEFVEKNQIPLPDIVKTDVQGHDFAVLSGARRALSHASVLPTEVIVDDIYLAPETLWQRIALIEDSGLRLWDISHIYIRIWKPRELCGLTQSFTGRERPVDNVSFT